MRLSEKINGSLSSKYDNSIIASLNESINLEEARSHKEDNEKAAPRKSTFDKVIDGEVESGVYDDKDTRNYKDRYKEPIYAKRNKIRNFKNIDYIQKPIEDIVNKSATHLDYEKPLNKDSADYKRLKADSELPFPDEEAGEKAKEILKRRGIKTESINLEEARSHKEDNEKAAPRDAKNKEDRLETFKSSVRKNQLAKRDIVGDARQTSEQKPYGKDFEVVRYEKLPNKHSNLLKIKKEVDSDPRYKDEYKSSVKSYIDKEIKDYKDAHKKEEVNEDYKLDTRFDPRASFYGKAEVKELPNGDKELYSYGTLVAAIRDGKPYTYGRFSQTTSRHQKEFFKQEGFEPSDAELTEGCKLNEDMKDDTASAAKQIALEIIERGIMGFEDIDNMAADILGITVDELKDKQLDIDIYTSLNYEGINQNFSTGDFFTQEYAEEHPEVLEESSAINLIEARSHKKDNEKQASNIVNSRKAKNESVKSLTLRPATVKLTEAESLELKVEYSIDDLDDLVWSGASDRWKDYSDEQKEYLVNYFYDTAGYIDGNVPTTTEFNDFIWFEADDLLEQEGLTNDSDDEEEDIDESANLKEDDHTDNFVISLITKDRVYWKRKSDGEEVVTTIDVFKDGIDPTEYRTELELQDYIIDGE